MNLFIKQAIMQGLIQINQDNTNIYSLQMLVKSLNLSNFHNYISLYKIYTKEMIDFDKKIKELEKQRQDALWNLKYADLRQKLTQTYVQSLGYIFMDSSVKVTGLRHHIGSSLAFCMAVHNLYYMKQSILKQTIHLTKSNNPKVIKIARIPLYGIYFIVLSALWHIPSISAEIGVRMNCRKLEIQS
ncbi:hypothetical protein pb186bvf_003556 [Paramecium bursaria]